MITRDDRTLIALARQHLALELTAVERRWLAQALAHWDAAGELTAWERGTVAWVIDVWTVEVGEV